MKKKILLSLLTIIIIPTLFLKYYSYKASSTYEDGNPPKNLNTTSPKTMIVSLIGNEEDFAGTVNLRYIHIDPYRIEIKLRNNAIEDDSIGSIEYYIIAEKKKDKWKIVQYKQHWKCARDLFFDFWTIGPCI